MRKYLFLVSYLPASVLVAGFLLLASPAGAASFDPSLDWQTIQTQHFQIHFAKGMEESVHVVAKYLEEAHEKLTVKFGWKPWGYTQVILVDNNDAANASTSTLPYNWMLLRMSAPDPDSVLAYYDNWLRTVIFHEYTHILHIDRTGGIVTIPRLLIGKMISPNGTVPGWMREGIATYFETTETNGGRGRFSYSEMMLRTAILENKFPKIDEADGLAWKWPSYQTMYIFGVKFLQYLTDTYGEEKLMEFHKRMGSTLLFFDVDHQARKVFVDVEYISQKQHNRYVRMKKPGTKSGITFPILWNEWIAKLADKYAKEKSQIEAEGLTEFEKVAEGETKLANPVVSPDGRYLAYSRSRVRAPHEIRLIDLKNGVDRVIIKKQDASRLSFSPDSKKIAYSALGAWKKYNMYSDIYLYDIENQKIERLTSGLRAKDPSFSPDGKKIVFVQQEAGRSWLAVYDVEGKESSEFIIPPNPPLEKGGEGGFEQFSSPAWSPDGKYIATSSWQPTVSPPLEKRGKGGFNLPYESGQWDIYLYDSATGAKVAQLTNDPAIDSRPVWSADGKSIYFSSDRSGVSNIYKATVRGSTGSPRTGTLSVRPELVEGRVTNVLSGAFQPAISPDGKTLYVQYYTSAGFDIRKTAVSREQGAGSSKEVSRGDPLWSPDKDKGGDGAPPLQKYLLRSNNKDDNNADSTTLALPKKYSSFGKSLFLPRFTVPAIAFQDNAAFLSIFTGSTDPLRRHIWRAAANYRSDLSSFFGYYFTYAYNRYRPLFNVGINEYAVNFGDLSFYHSSTKTINTVHLYEGRRRLFGGASYPFGKNAIGLNYFWEDRRSLSNLDADEKNAINLGKFAGFSATYSYGQVEKYPASISPEKGRRLRANFTITDSRLASSEKNEQRIFAGDYREYISMLWLNHVIALRTSGGITFGDTLVQGTFSMGGDLGEGIMGGGGESLFYFPLRGLTVSYRSRTRALLFSGEYRMPLISPQRGISTRPYFIRNIHIAPFLDYGNAWNASTEMWGDGRYFFNDFFLGTGTELRGDFVIGHGLPVTGRLGYGMILVNRDRLGTSTAPVFGSPLKNGVAILQFGTSF